MNATSKTLFLALCEDLWAYRGMPSTQKLITTILNLQRCGFCHAPFTASDNRVEHCSQSCAQMARRQWGTKGERREGER